MKTSALCLFRLSVLVDFFSRFVVSVAAFVFSLIKDGLQQQGERCDGRHFVQVSRVTHASWKAFSSFWKFLAVRVVLEGRRRRSPQTLARHFYCRCHHVGRASTGEVDPASGDTPLGTVKE